MKISSGSVVFWRIFFFVLLLLYSMLVFPQANMQVMPARTLVQFNAKESNASVELKGALMASHTFEKIVVERSNGAGVFTAIGNVPLTTNVDICRFNFVDGDPTEGVNCYRVRLVNPHHNYQEISSVIMVKVNDGESKDLKLVNTMVSSSNPVLTFNHNVDEEATIQVTNMSGNLVCNSKFGLQEGYSLGYLPGLANRKGYFFITLRTQDDIVRQKIFVQ